jgi:hypothetical protein
LPVALDAVLVKALVKQPEQRYGRAGELLIDFRAALGAPSSGSNVLTQPFVPGPTVDVRNALAAGPQPTAQQQQNPGVAAPQPQIPPVLYPDGVSGQYAGRPSLREGLVAPATGRLLWLMLLGGVGGVSVVIFLFPLAGGGSSHSPLAVILEDLSPLLFIFSFFLVIPASVFLIVVRCILKQAGARVPTNNKSVW